MSENEYKYIDLEYINDMGDGDNDFLIKIIGVYLNAIPADLEKLAEAAANKDGEQIIFYAHKLKGSFNFIGSTQLTETFDQIEAYAPSAGTMQFIAPMVQEVIEKSDKITLELMHFLEKVKADNA